MSDLLAKVLTGLARVDEPRSFDLTGESVGKACWESLTGVRRLSRLLLPDLAEESECTSPVLEFWGTSTREDVM